MKFFEKILVALILVGLVFKLAHLPGTAMILALSFTALASLYFAFSFLLFNGIRLRNIFKIDSYRDVSRGRLFGAIWTGIVLSIVLIGVLFDLLVLPGREAMLIIGTISLGTFFVWVLLKILTSGISQYYLNLLIRMIPILIVGLILYLVPLEKQIDFFYRGYPEYANAYKEYLKDPANEELYLKLMEERKKMND